MTVVNGTIQLPDKFGNTTGSIDDLKMDRTGFTLGTAEITGDLKLGKLLEADSFDLSLNGLHYDNSTHAFGASVFTATVAVATLFPGGAATATAKNLKLSIDFADGTYAMSADSLDATVKDVLDVHATGLSFDLSSSNYSVAVASATASVPRLKGLTGAIKDLKIDDSGMTLGSASLYLDGVANFAAHNAIQITNPSVTIAGLTYAAGGGGFAFNGDLTYSAASAGLSFSNTSFTATLSQVSGTIGLTSADLGQMSLDVGSLNLALGKILTLTGSSIAIDTDPGAAHLLSVGALDATVKIPNTELALNGSATHFSLDPTSDGTVAFDPGQDFSVTLSLDPSVGADLKLPTWLPLTLTKLGRTGPTSRPTRRTSHSTSRRRWTRRSPTPAS